MKNDIKANILRLMEAKGSNPTALARASGMNQPTLHRILNGTVGNPRVDTLIAIANALGVTVTEIVTGHEPCAASPYSPSIPFGNFCLVGDEIEFQKQENDINIGLLGMYEGLYVVALQRNELGSLLKRGDLAIIDTNLKAIASGDVYAVFYKGRFMFAYLKENLNGKIEISTSSDDKALVENQKDLLLVGRVIKTMTVTNM